MQGPVAGGDPFGVPPSSGGKASSDPFGGGGSSHDDSKTPPTNDPFADPFGSDSFGSAGWTGDSPAVTDSAGMASSTPKGTKTTKKVCVCVCVCARVCIIALPLTKSCVVCDA